MKSNARSASSARNLPGCAKPDGTDYNAVSLSWRHLAYYLGVPLGVAIYAGLSNWELLEIAGYSAGLGFYLGHALLPWWTTCACTSLAKRTLARWKPPWLLILLLGHFAGSIIVVPYSNWLTGLYGARYPELGMSSEFAPLFSMDFWGYFVRAGIVWIATNYIFDRFLGLPLYRYDIPRGFDMRDTAERQAGGPTGSAWTGQAPGFVSRLPVSLEPGQILAIKAEQHYIRVYSPDKEYMVLYRFSDAIRELDAEYGLQVHRSYWVNRNAVEDVSARSKKFLIRLTSGIDVPVSVPYQGLVREFARHRGIPVHG